MNESTSIIEMPESPPAAMQFGLLTMFYIMSIYTVGLALGTWTLLPTTVVLVLWGLDRLDGRSPTLISSLLALYLLGMALPPLGPVQNTGDRTICYDNVRRLTIGIINFEAAHQKFPPAYEVDDNGQPKHSWRVLILPHMGYKNLFATYNLNEPWNSPSNSKLLNQMPKEFRCPYRPHTNQTHYKLVVDTGTPFEEGRAVNFSDIKDGASNTMCIVEDAAHPVPWTKPEGITIEEACAAIAPQDPYDIAHIDYGFLRTDFTGASCSLIDGATYFIGPTAKLEMIKNLLVCNDGGTFDHDELGQSISVTHWDKYFVLAVYVCLLILPVFFRPPKRIENAESSTGDTIKHE